MSKEQVIDVRPSLSMAFNPEPWNKPDAINLNNCFAYAMNNPYLGWTMADKIRPGQQGDGPKPAIPETCSIVMKNWGPRFEKFGIERISPHQYSPDQRHIFAMFGHNEHFARLDGDNIWSHKAGRTYAKNLDDNGITIVAIESAKIWSGAEKSYWALPIDGIKVEQNIDGSAIYRNDPKFEIRDRIQKEISAFTP